MSNQILIVSDEDHQREAILRQAARAGFADQEIVVAIDEASAYDRIKTGEFQVAVVDLCLNLDEDPSDGLRVIKALNEEQPACRIVGLTRFAKDSAERCPRCWRERLHLHRVGLHLVDRASEEPAESLAEGQSADVRRQVKGQQPTRRPALASFSPDGQTSLPGRSDAMIWRSNFKTSLYTISSLVRHLAIAMWSCRCTGISSTPLTSGFALFVNDHDEPLDGHCLAVGSEFD